MLPSPLGGIQPGIVASLTGKAPLGLSSWVPAGRSRQIGHYFHTNIISPQIMILPVTQPRSVIIDKEIAKGGP